MPKRKVNPLRNTYKELEFALRDVLLFRLFGVPSIFSSELLYVRRVNENFRHNYQRDQAPPTWDVFYNKQRLCRIVRSSPCKVKVDQQYGETKFTQKILERICHDYLPTAEIEVVYDF